MAVFKFIDRTGDAKREMNAKIDRTLDDIGIHLEGEAIQEIQNSPVRVDTGLLKNSITHALAGHKPAKGEYRGDRPSRQNKSGEIPTGSYSGVMGDQNEKAVYMGTNVEYAVYVHEGTERMAPNRFIKNAVVKNEEQIRKWINDDLNQM